MRSLAQLMHTTALDRPIKAKRFSLLLFWVCFLFLHYPSTTLSAAENHFDQLHPFIDNGGYALKIDGKTVGSYNIDDTFVPASTMKILTSLIALEILGPDYRFATYFSLDNNKNLYIKGEGDPFLVSENITFIAEQLKKLNITKINTIFFDDSAFALESAPSGSENTDNPYDAHSGALAVNFNALPFRVLSNGTVVSGEKQTPLLPIMEDIGRRYKKGRYRVNINGFPVEKDYSNTLRYAGELFTTIFEKSGIHISNGFAASRVSQEAKPVFTYQSDKTVSDLVQKILFYSNNFIANQLYLSSGRRFFGTPATWEKSARMAKKFIDMRLQLPHSTIHMVDGSGLSRDNRMSPAAMLTILNRFAPYAQLLKQNGNILVKSGTFTGAYCYAGYFQDGPELAPFALFLNQGRNTRKKLLHLLHQEYNSRIAQ
jgi:D-alanyl-D-alanine carboxypeptidase/D-alanyl-D-alanine-endopeptidase (penicillin-binding protein 4)